MGRCPRNAIAYLRAIARGTLLNFQKGKIWLYAGKPVVSLSSSLKDLKDLCKELKISRWFPNFLGQRIISREPQINNLGTPQRP